jgi:hypothetical protein
MWAARGAGNVIHLAKGYHCTCVGSVSFSRFHQGRQRGRGCYCEVSSVCVIWPSKVKLDRDKASSIYKVLAGDPMSVHAQHGVV